jgi:hypothetical protein
MGGSISSRPIAMTNTFLYRIASALASLAACAVLAAPALVVEGYPAPAVEKAAAPAQLRLSAKATTPRLVLPAVGDEEVEIVRKANRAPLGKRVMIGVGRDAPTALEASGWTAVDGGKAMRLSAISPEALGMRIGFDVSRLSPEVEMVFFGSGEARLIGPIRVGDIADRAATWWSPVTEGDTQTVEFFLPGGGSADGLSARVSSVSHLFFSPASGFTKNAAQIGASGSCNIDFQCVTSPSQALQNARNSVAKMTYNVGSSSFLCTGQVLADTAASATPWFYGANHCFESESPPYRTPQQMAVIAATLNTFWFFEANSCGSTAVPPFVQRTGGATYLFNNVNTDVLFLRLNEAPPAGSFFTGWDANAIAIGSTVVGLHHPMGDLKKFSQGNATAFITDTPGSTPASFIEVQWFDGTTEGGSSGSGIWTFANSQYFLRGGLLGGAASCSNLTGRDKYSRFDQAFPSISQFLAPATGGATNYTALWWNSPAGSESGWGINLNHQANIIFATLFNYAADNQSTWVVASNLALQPNGSFSGQLFRLTGPPFFDNPWNPAGTVLSTVGTMTLSFSGPSNGTLTYSINGTTVTKSITRQVFSSPVPTCTLGTGSRAGLTNYQDLWFNPSESGWGINFTHQGNIIFATLFNYDAARRDLWLVASSMNRQPDGSYSGELYITTGPAFNSVPWPSSSVTVTTVGTMSVRFSNGENGVLTYTASGNTVVKSITRQVFGSTVPFCQ